MTENNSKAVEIALNRVEEAKKRRTRMNEGTKAVQVSHAEGAHEVRSAGSKAIVKTLVYNKEDENHVMDGAKADSIRITDVKLKHFDKSSEKEFLDYTHKALNAAKLTRKRNSQVNVG